MSDDLFSSAAKKGVKGPKGPKPASATASPTAKEGKAGKGAKKNDKYTAHDIEVLEGLEPVRHRPGMYIGGTDERALHHLVAEVLDNSMDEAVAGHANRIDMTLSADNTVTISDNGRGIPVDPHPKFKDKSALEVILTTLHAGGKFSDKVYHTAGGLHGVGVSVVNALSDALSVEVARDKQVWTQDFCRGKPTGKLKKGGKANRRGTTIRFHPDPEIFGEEADFSAARLYRMARSKAYLYRGVEIRWACDPKLLEAINKKKKSDEEEIPAKASLHFPGGLRDFLDTTIGKRPTVTPAPFAGTGKLAREAGTIEWAITWFEDQGNGSFLNSYCNTVPTPDGGTHEAGFRSALIKGLKTYGEMTGNKKAAKITGDDVMDAACGLISLFIRDPLFQGQTKEKLNMPDAARLIEASVKDHFDHWLSGDKETATDLLDFIIERAEERVRSRQAKEMNRKTATRKLRLPGKLSDCTRKTPEDTELFLVEGDSAGGSAKQARFRETQAILPLRGKILNVANATADKMHANQELRDLQQALGCGTGAQYDETKLRYERIIIMTDADVDGAHIASLLMTYFYKEMPGLIEGGHLYLALPPLYRISQGDKSEYARDDAHKQELMKTVFKGRGKIEISRFKGLGEMPAKQLKETTMDPAKRTLLRVTVPDWADEEQRRAARNTSKLVESLMGKKPELRLAYIQKNAKFVGEIDV
ncbi:MAG: DNA topoisomerase IV subunit B [Rhodospirillaceae bacterium]|jgi:topoisomerase IV subunit B|nr:DNA topoisomerase IV subunit B [Rhodospirillaceae bacterium]MBT5751969.1 DNA topoisomerase IV subunit B [Rhodospirillaceae bacterium]